jgi:hypothetical protein
VGEILEDFLFIFSLLSCIYCGQAGPQSNRLSSQESRSTNTGDARLNRLDRDDFEQRLLRVRKIGCRNPASRSLCRRNQHAACLSVDADFHIDAGSHLALDQQWEERRAGDIDHKLSPRMSALMSCLRKQTL